MQRPDADDLGGDVHVAHRHPHAADPAAHQVLGGEREHHDDRQDEQVLRAGVSIGMPNSSSLPTATEPDGA